MNTLQTQFLEHNGGKIAYDDTGRSGAVVVCLPGVGDLRAQYRFLAPALAEAGFRVVTADLRGQGESSVNWHNFTVQTVARDLRALIDHLGAAPALVVGSGIGATAAAWVAAEHPSKIEALALLSPFVRDVASMGGRPFAFNARMNRWWGPSVWVGHLKARYRTAPPDLDSYFDALKAALKARGGIVALKAFARVSKYIGEPRLSQIQAPALIVTGAADPEFPDPTAEGVFVAELLGGPTRVLSVGEAGHFPHVERPEKVNPQVVRFFGQVRRAQDGGGPVQVS